MKQSKKANSRGFSHHFLLPVIAILLVGGIGSYVMLRSSSAASTTKSCRDLIFSRYQHTATKYKSCVKAIQNKVGASADGIFGPRTQAHVKTWQRNHGLTADGVVGPKTWKKMGIHPTYKTQVSTVRDPIPVKTAKTAYKLTLGTRHEYPDRTKVTTKTYHNVSMATVKKYNEANKKVLAQQTADDKRFNLTWEFLTTSMKTATLKDSCAALGGTVKSKLLGPNSSYVASSTKTAEHYICGN